MMRNSPTRRTVLIAGAANVAGVDGLEITDIPHGLAAQFGEGGVHVTVVQMPAVNTPQFSWVRSRLPNHPQPVPPIYQPGRRARRRLRRGAPGAEAVLGRREYRGHHPRQPAGPGAAGSLARTGYGSQQTAQAARPGRPDHLVQPVDGSGGHDHGARGAFDDRSHRRSLQLWLSHHARATTARAGGPDRCPGRCPGREPLRGGGVLVHRNTRLSKGRSEHVASARTA
jgi:hypothetical protein